MLTIEGSKGQRECYAHGSFLRRRFSRACGSFGSFFTGPFIVKSNNNNNNKNNGQQTSLIMSYKSLYNICTPTRRREFTLERVRRSIAAISFSTWPRRRSPSCHRNQWQCTCRPQIYRSSAPTTTPSTENTATHVSFVKQIPRPRFSKEREDFRGRR